MGEFTTRGALRVALAVMLTGAICVPTLAFAQDDDWEFAEDATRGLTVATVRYDGGKGVVAECRSGELKLVLVGLPATTADRRRFDVTRPDGRRDVQGWEAEPGQTAFSSTVAGRDIRFLRGGGLYDLRSSAGETAPVHASFDLPTENANLDRVLTACGYAVTDERDALQRADETLKTKWEVEHANDRPWTPPRSRSVSGRPQPRAPSTPSPRVIRSSDTSCVVRDGAYADCRVDHTTAAPPARSNTWLRQLNGTKLEPVSAAANEGRVYYPGSVSGLVTVIDYIATVPAG